MPRVTAPSGLSAVAVSSSEISLQWTDNASNEAGYSVERSLYPSDTYVTVASLGIGATSFTDKGLQASTAYSYRVRATGRRISSPSNVATATTLAASGTDTTPPTVVIQGPISTASSSTSTSSTTSGGTIVSGVITISASASDNTAVAKVEFYCDNGILLAVETAAPYSVNVDTTKSPDGSHSFYAKAYDAANNSAVSSPVFLTYDNPPPAAPGGLSATAVSSSQITLTWQDNSTNEGGFVLERSTSSTFASVVAVTLGVNVTSYNDTGLSASTVYYYRVKATSANWGDSSYSATVSATTADVAPAAPGGLTASAVSATQINLGWADNSNNETGFKIERATSSSGPWSQVASVGAGVNSYADSGLTASTAYYYRVRATNSVGDSGYSNTANATTQASVIVSPPAAPSGLSASKASSSQINLWWTDNSNNETGFKVERAFSYGGPWSQVATVGAGVTSYADTGLVASTFYSYRVRATNAGGDSSCSNISGDTTLAGSTTVTVPAAPSSLSASAISSSQINLSWIDNASNETGFKIQRSTSASGPWTQIATVGSGVTSYSDTGLAASTMYYYQVSATNSAGDSAYSNQAVTTTFAAVTATPPNAPSGLSASVTSASQINLGWTDNSSNETGFKVESASSSSGPWTQIAAVGAGVTSYAHTGLLASTLYYYRVYAYNSAGNSAYSAVSSATTLATTSTPTTGGALTIPSGHPRLWWNAARLAQARTYFASHSFTPSSGDPFANALAYQMTGNSTYARTAINWLVSYQIPAGQASPTAVGSDNARWDGENAVLVFDWCWDQMTASERSTVINNWNTWLAAINQQSWGGVGMEMNNYYWGNLRNSLEWGIATYGESSQAQGFIDHALTTRWQNSFLPFAATFGKGGVLQEGPGYGAVTAWYPAVPFTSCGLLGRNVWNEGNFFKETVMYILYATTPALTTRKGDTANTYELFPFNDSEYPQNGSIFNIRKYHGDFMNVAANQWSGIGIGQYARQWVNTVQPSTSWHVAAVDPGTPALGYSGLPLDYYASGTSYLFARNAWGTTSTSVNMLMGAPTGVGHAHRDIGSFQIWRNGRWVSRNTGGYSNSIIGYGGTSVDVSMPSAHNVVLFNGVGQLADSWAKGDSTLLRLEVKPGYVYAAVDLTAIYKANADFAGRVPEAPLNSYIREYVFVRSTETLYVCDRIDAASAVTATFLLHSEQNSPLFSSVAKVGTPSATRTVDEGVSNAWAQYRFEYDYPVSGKTYFVRAISPSGVADSSVTFNASGVGGTFNGTAFGTGIATCTVTDNGPVWNP